MSVKIEIDEATATAFLHSQGWRESPLEIFPTRWVDPRREGDPGYIHDRIEEAVATAVSRLGRHTPASPSDDGPGSLRGRIDTR